MKILGNILKVGGKALLTIPFVVGLWTILFLYLPDFLQTSLDTTDSLVAQAIAPMQAQQEMLTREILTGVTVFTILLTVISRFLLVEPLWAMLGGIGGLFAKKEKSAAQLEKEYAKAEKAAAKQKAAEEAKAAKEAEKQAEIEAKAKEKADKVAAKQAEEDAKAAAKAEKEAQKAADKEAKAAKDTEKQDTDLTAPIAIAAASAAAAVSQIPDAEALEEAGIDTLPDTPEDVPEAELTAAELETSPAVERPEADTIDDLEDIASADAPILEDAPAEPEITPAPDEVTNDLAELDVADDISEPSELEIETPAEIDAPTDDIELPELDTAELEPAPEIEATSEPEIEAELADFKDELPDELPEDLPEMDDLPSLEDATDVTLDAPTFESELEVEPPAAEETAPEIQTEASDTQIDAAPTDIEADEFPEIDDLPTADLETEEAVADIDLPDLPDSSELEAETTPADLEMADLPDTPDLDLPEATIDLPDVPDIEAAQETTLDDLPTLEDTPVLADIEAAPDLPDTPELPEANETEDSKLKAAEELPEAPDDLPDDLLDMPDLPDLD